MRLLRRIWYRLNRRWWERELEREMAAHRAAMGEPQRFGNLLRLREESADMWGWTWLDDSGVTSATAHPSRPRPGGRDARAPRRVAGRAAALRADRK